MKKFFVKDVTATGNNQVFHVGVLGVAISKTPDGRREIAVWHSFARSARLHADAAYDRAAARWATRASEAELKDAIAREINSRRNLSLNLCYRQDADAARRQLDLIYGWDWV